MTDEDRSRAISIIKEFFPDATVAAHPDFAAAFFESEGGTYIFVISGTGSLVCSWDGEKMNKSGGRGYLLGDEGSAFQYGRDALLAFLANPIAASTPLKKCVVDVFEADDEPTIVSRLYRSPSPQAALAKLAKPLAADYRAGLEYAVASIAKNTAALARVVLDHRSAFLPWKKEIRVSLTGGLWKTSSIFVDSLASNLEGHDVEFHLDRIKTPPVLGAVKLAKELAIGH